MYLPLSRLTYQTLRRPGFYLGLLILAFFLTGLRVVTHYGETSDEEFRNNYAHNSLQAYLTGDTAGLLDEKGAFYSMLGVLGSAVLKGITPWAEIDCWHFMTFLAYLAGIFFFYRLCRRLVKPWPALAATLLFSTQPLLWGHAFMNPKDTPFMAFFMGSVALGLEMVDHFFPPALAANPTITWGWLWPDLRAWLAKGPERRKALAADWQAALPGLRRLAVSLALLATGLALTAGWVQTVIRDLVTRAAIAPAGNLGRELFLRLAKHSNQIPVVDYANKGAALYLKILLYGEAGLVLAIVCLALLVFPSLYDLRRQATAAFSDFMQAARRIPGRLAALYGQFHDDLHASSGRLQAVFAGLKLLLLILLLSYPAAHVLAARHLAQAENLAIPNSQMLVFWLTAGLVLGLVALLTLAARKISPGVTGRLLARLADPHLLAAGLLLGLASAIRTLGPASGLLVAVVLLARGGKKALLPLLEYVGLGGLVATAFWPWLWGSPIANYLSSLTQAVDFHWDNTVLFGGQIYDVTRVPVRYIPTLFSLQLTETTLLAVGAGLIVAILYLFTRAGLRLEMLVLGAWLAAPIGAALVMHSTVYDNARQFLFVLPPLFVLTGLALQQVWEQRNRLVFVLVVLALLAPGLYWDVRLHPYEYIYYNSLAGGVAGAFRSYELDYWGVSYKDEFTYLNQVAPPNAVVYVYGPNLIAHTYARPDLKIQIDTDTAGADYAVILNKRDMDLTLFPNFPVIHDVEREGAVLSVLKKVSPGN